MAARSCFLHAVFWLIPALEVWWYLHLRDLHKYLRCLHHLLRSNTNVAQRAKMCQVATRRFHNDNPCFEKVALASEKGSRCEKQRLFRSSEAIPWWKMWKHIGKQDKNYTFFFHVFKLEHMKGHLLFKHSIFKFVFFEGCKRWIKAT